MVGKRGHLGGNCQTPNTSLLRGYKGEGKPGSGWSRERTDKGQSCVGELPAVDGGADRVVVGSCRHRGFWDTPVMGSDTSFQKLGRTPNSHLS